MPSAPLSSIGLQARIASLTAQLSLLLGAMADLEQPILNVSLVDTRAAEVCPGRVSAYAHCAAHDFLLRLGASGPRGAARYALVWVSLCAVYAAGEVGALLVRAVTCACALSALAVTLDVPPTSSPWSASPSLGPT